MKILLISSNIADTPYPIYPLGLGMIATALHKAGHDIHQFDFLQSGRSIDALTRTIQEYDPELIGISIRNIDNVNLLHEERYIDVVKIIVKAIRQQTNTPIILGGSGFSIMPELILNEVGADYGIIGEGEALIVEFAAKATEGIFPQQKCLRSSSRVQGEKIPSACYNSQLMEFYLKSGHMAPIQTKRGCTHQCLYCSYPLLEGATIRCRDHKAVVDDIQHLVHTHKAQYIFFTDSVFNDDQQHYLAVIREMKKRDVYIPWTAFFTPEGLDDDKVALMKQTGLKAAEMGADAASDTTLKKLGKRFLFKDVLACNNLFSRHSVATAHYFMFGCPAESQKSVLEGIENIKSLEKTVSFIFMGIRILPKTALADTAIREGILSPTRKLLEPVYYIAPNIDKQWLKKTLTNAFSGLRSCIFPPDSMDSSVRFLHEMGHTGSLWDMLIQKNNYRARRRRYER